MPQLRSFGSNISKSLTWPGAESALESIGDPSKIRYAKAFGDREACVSENRDQYDAAAGDGRIEMSDAEEAPRMRFRGIVEANSSEASITGAAYGVGPVFVNEHRWNSMSRQVWLASRLIALLLPCVFLVGRKSVV